jgi:hypothetical protein
VTQTYEEGHGLAVVDTSAPLALPVVTPEEAKAAMAQYLELCESVLGPDDYQEFSQKAKVAGQWIWVKKKFKKKSAVKKLQTFFGVEVQVKSTTRDELGADHYGFRVVATATARNGRVVEATGACSTQEERFEGKPAGRSYHDILSTAETRATNRAVMNCIGVGGGEVTADEVSRDKTPPAPRNATPRPQAVPPAESAEQVEKRKAEGIKRIRIYCREKGISESEYRRLLLEDPAFSHHFMSPEDEVTGKALTLDELQRFSLALQAIAKAKAEK